MTPDAMSPEAWTFTAIAFVVLVAALALLAFLTRGRKPKGDGE